MNEASASVQTRLVRGSDIAAGKPVRVLAGVYAGTEGIVYAVYTGRCSHHVTRVYDGVGIGVYAPSELEPLEAEQ